MPNEEKVTRKLRATMSADVKGSEDVGKLFGVKAKPSAKKWVWPLAAAVVILLGIVTCQFYQKMITPEFEPASVEEMAFPLPEKPSIAVLSFDNMSGEPEQEYFSDGITENIITTLSKVGELFVIARNSSFSYKGKPVKIQKISEELGVRYVLRGSFKKSGDRVRITAQLIDAIKGQHLWVENYDRDFKDIIEIQDEITKNIVSNLRIILTEGEHSRVYAKYYKSMEVYLKHLQVSSLGHEGTKKGFIRAGQLAQEIIDIEPESPVGYMQLGFSHYGLALRGYASLQKSLDKSFELAQKAISLDESIPESHALLGQCYLLMWKYDKAIESMKRAVELKPNGALIHALYGEAISYTEDLDEGIAHIKQAIRLDPFPPYWYYHILGRIYWMNEQYRESITELKKVLQHSPDSLLTHVVLAADYVALDRQEEAEATGKRILEIIPNFSIELYSTGWPFLPTDYQNLVDALHKAGLPE